MLIAGAYYLLRKEQVSLFLLACLQDGNLRDLYTLLDTCDKKPETSDNSPYFAVRALSDLSCVVFVSEEESVILDFPRHSIELQVGKYRFYGVTHPCPQSSLAYQILRNFEVLPEPENYVSASSPTEGISAMRTLSRYISPVFLSNLESSFSRNKKNW